MVGLADGISCHVFSFITEMLVVNERRPEKDHCIPRADGISCHVFSFITELLEVNERRPKKDHCIARSHKKKRTWCLIHRMQKAYCWQWLENDHCTLKHLTQPPPCLEISFVVPSVYLMRPKPDLCVASFASRRSLPESKSCNSLWSSSLSFIFPSHRSYLTFKLSAQRRRFRASCAIFVKSGVGFEQDWRSSSLLLAVCRNVASNLPVYDTTIHNYRNLILHQ